MRIERILCAVDFSGPSDEALKAAADLAARFDASLTLAHVYQLAGFPSPEGAILPDPETMTRLVAAAEAQLAEARIEALRCGAPRVETVALEGLPWREIVELAGRGRFGMLVLGTHGRTGFRHLLLGSVAEHVVRHAPCPVLTVRPPGLAAPAQASA